jgi:hypothetical protein
MPGVLSSRTCLAAGLIATAVSAGPAQALSAPGPVIMRARELAGVMDFTKLPVLPGSKVSRGGQAALELSVPGTVAEVATFYRKTFEGLGWKPQPRPDGLVTHSDTAETASSVLWKDKFCLSLSVLNFGGKKTTTVSLLFLGNLDTRTLPRVEGAEPLYSSQTQTIFTTEVSAAKAESELAKALTAEGWQAYSAAEDRSGGNAGEHRFLDFRKEGYTVHVQIGPSPANRNRTAVHYTVHALSHELPAPPEATDVRFTDERWEMRCEVPGDLKAMIAYYEKAMPDAGYTATARPAATETKATLRFETEGKDVILVQLAAAGKKTTVQMIGVPATVVAEAKKRDLKK